MFPEGPNPTKLQSAPGSALSPLVLIHDGGGTTFSYFFLGSLGRDVWALHNPNYWSGEKVEGGIDAMARTYITLIRNAGLRGRLFLGGWSLGGYLALAIARMVADDKTALFSVRGLVLVDSPFHTPYNRLDAPVVDPVMSDLPKPIQVCFAHCDDYLKAWEVPAFDAPTRGGQPVALTVGGQRFTLASGQCLHQPVSGKWTVLESPKTASDTDGKPGSQTQGQGEGGKVEPPPGAMLRCTERTKSPRDDVGCTVDLYRDEPLLGWGEGRYPDFIKLAMDVDAAHFDLFDRDNDKRLESVTSKIDTALRALEKIR